MDVHTTKTALDLHKQGWTNACPRVHTGAHLDQEHTITWITNYAGTTYVLDHQGRLQPAQRTGAAMSTAHLDQMRENRQRDAARAVHNELLQLATRRAEEHARQQEQPR